MVPGFLPPTMDERQFSGASDHSDSEASRTFWNLLQTLMVSQIL